MFIIITLLHLELMKEFIFKRSQYCARKTIIELKFKWRICLSCIDWRRIIIVEEVESNNHNGESHFQSMIPLEINYLNYVSISTSITQNVVKLYF